MKYYNKKELLDRLYKGFDLKDDEYKVLIRNGIYQLSDRLFDISGDDYDELYMQYMMLGALGTNMKYGEDYDKDLPRACGCMMVSFPINTLNHIRGLKNSDVALERLCRFNTVNFLNEVSEIQRFDSLIGDLYDSINEVVQYGFNPGSSIELNDRMDDLQESTNKIKVLRNKYIK